MSAFLVGKAHIDALVTAALASPRFRLTWYDRNIDNAWEESGGDGDRYHALLTEHRHEATYAEADAIGRMLWLENLASVAARYPDDVSGTRPGPCDLTDEQITAYTYQRPRTSLSAVATLKALRCYEYQSCEHDGWKASEAYQFCQALQAALITRLPGYEDADWEVA